MRQQQDGNPPPREIGVRRRTRRDWLDDAATERGGQRLAGRLELDAVGEDGAPSAAKGIGPRSGTTVRPLESARFLGERFGATSLDDRRDRFQLERSIGRASCRERVCLYV